MSLDTDILNDFRSETNGLLAELNEIVEKLEEEAAKSFPSALLEDFAQKIDRIMGAAKTLSLMEPGHLGLQRIGKLGEICKHIGYKAAEKSAIALIPYCTAFWADTIEVIGDLVKTVDDAEKNAEVARSFSQVLQKRLEWLGSRVDKDVGALGKEFK